MVKDNLQKFDSKRVGGRLSGMYSREAEGKVQGGDGK